MGFGDVRAHKICINSEKEPNALKAKRSGCMCVRSKWVIVISFAYTWLVYCENSTLIVSVSMGVRRTWGQFLFRSQECN